MERSVFQHPQATHRVVLDGEAVAYLLRRSARRSIGMRISEEGLQVTVPSRLALSDVEAGLQSRARWILKHLHEVQTRSAEMQKQMQWGDGSLLPYLGREMVLRVHAAASPAWEGVLPVVQGCVPGRNRRARHAVQHVPAERLERAGGHWRDELHLQWDGELMSTTGQIQHLVMQWYQERALEWFAARMDHFAPLVGVEYRALRLSNARTRWGSASVRGVIHLHWRLMECEPALIDYVVVHELCHLHEMNHSPRFWALVESVLPDFRDRRQRLKQKRLSPW